MTSGANIILMCLLCFVAIEQSSSRHPARYSSADLCPTWTHYWEEASGVCKKCSKCSKGSGVSVPCSDTNNTVCAKCELGVSFSSRRSHSPCSLCNDCGGRKVIRKCSLKRNTVCGDCPFGLYWDDIYSACRPCSYCYDNKSTFNLVRECGKKGIPATHQCAYMISPPFPAPVLALRSDGNAQFFVDEISEAASSQDLDLRKNFLKQNNNDKKQQKDQSADSDATDYTNEDLAYITQEEILKESGKTDPLTIYDQPSNSRRYCEVTSATLILLIIAVIVIIVNGACAIAFYRKRRSLTNYKPIYKPNNEKNFH